MKSLLAHGPLGIFDELAYMIPSIILALSMGLNWLRWHKTRLDSPRTTNDNSPHVQLGNEPADVNLPD